MGQVYEVKHVELGRTAALKMMRPELAQNEETAARFFTEARAMSMVHHAGLIHVYEYGHTDDGGAYIVMEFAEGPTLRQHIADRGGKLPPLSAATLAYQIAAALGAAHDKGVIHRDLKPDNIAMVGGDDASLESTIKVLDFGLAKLPSATPDIHGPKTKPGQVLGTPLYMAPEQAGAPGGIGPHTDVYALGAVLFEMVTGTPPFTAEGAVQLVGKHLFTEAPRLRTLCPGVSFDLDELVYSMLAKAPADRPSMREVKERLKRIRRLIAAGPMTARGTRAEEEGNGQAETMLLRRGKPAPGRPGFNPLAILGWPGQKIPTLLLAGLLGGLLFWSVWSALRPASPQIGPNNVAPRAGADSPSEPPQTGTKTPAPSPNPATSATPPASVGASSASGATKRKAPRPPAPATSQPPATQPAEQTPPRPTKPAIKIVD